MRNHIRRITEDVDKVFGLHFLNLFKDLIHTSEQVLDG